MTISARRNRPSEASAALANAWVLTDRRRSFPLLYGWRVLPAPGLPSAADELGDLDALIHFWDDSPAVRDRLTPAAPVDGSMINCDPAPPS